MQNKHAARATVGMVAALAIGSIFGWHASAQAASLCDRPFSSGMTLETYHDGPTVGFKGTMDILGVYNCPEGTCFVARMDFTSYPGDDFAFGIFDDKRLILRRYVNQTGTPQRWEGRCLDSRLVTGHWHFELDPSNDGSFRLYL